MPAVWGGGGAGWPLPAFETLRLADVDYAPPAMGAAVDLIAPVAFSLDRGGRFRRYGPSDCSRVVILRRFENFEEPSWIVWVRGSVA